MWSSRAEHSQRRHSAHKTTPCSFSNTTIPQACSVAPSHKRSHVVLQSRVSMRKHSSQQTASCSLVKDQKPSSMLSCTKSQKKPCGVAEQSVYEKTFVTTDCFMLFGQRPEAIKHAQLHQVAKETMWCSRAERLREKVHQRRLLHALWSKTTSPQACCVAFRL